MAGQRDGFVQRNGTFVQALLHSRSSSFTVSSLLWLHRRCARPVCWRHTHPLQPFSPRAFGEDGAPRSYRQDYLAGARALRSPPVPPAPFLPGPLTPIPDDERSLDLGALIRFAQGPTAWMLRSRLGVGFRDLDALVRDREPMILDELEQWSLGDRLLARLVDGQTLDEAQRALTQMGLLPLGTPGRRAFRGAAERVHDLSEHIRRLAQGAPAGVAMRISGTSTHDAGTAFMITVEGYSAVPPGT